MFDLDTIEKDWKENSFCLSDEEIRNIYIAEGVTTKAYNDSYNESLHELRKNGITAEQKLLIAIFGTEEEKAKERERIERENASVLEMHKDEPTRPYLSHESWMKVVEGSMDIVFNLTRVWYDSYNGKFSMEDLYYAALEGLFAAAKYCLHYTTKNCFRAYAKSFIRIQMIKCVAKKEHISYRNAYCIDMHCFDGWHEHAEENKSKYSVQEFSFDYDKEIPYKPSSIYEMTKDEYEEPDYTKEISSEEFMKDYTDALKELKEDEYRIMTLAYTKDGFPGLTHNEISDYLGMKPKDISNAKRRVKKRLNSDPRFNKYKD